MGVIRSGEFDPTTSDGCTFIGAVFKFFTKEKHLPFKSCCVEHDRAYWYGGDVKLREQADRDMRDCVKAHGYPVIAWIMWLFVHMFSGPRLLWVFKNPLPWAWVEKVTILTSPK